MVESMETINTSCAIKFVQLLMESSWEKWEIQVRQFSGPLTGTTLRSWDSNNCC